MQDDLSSHCLVFILPKGKKRKKKRKENDRGMFVVSKKRIFITLSRFFHTPLLPLLQTGRERKRKGIENDIYSLNTLHKLHMM
jgi:hypothetical protein